VENGVGKYVPVGIGGIELIHEGLILIHAEVAITLEARGIVLKHIGYMHKQIEESGGIAVAHLDRRFVYIVAIVIVRILVIPRGYKTKDSGAPVEIECIGIIPVEN